MNNTTMKNNVFDQNENINQFTLSHSDEEAIIKMAKESGIGDLQKAIEIFANENDCIAHGLDLGDAESAIAKLDRTKDTIPEVLSIQETKSFISAYAITKEGKLIIEEDGISKTEQNN